MLQTKKKQSQKNFRQTTPTASDIRIRATVRTMSSSANNSPSSSAEVPQLPVASDYADVTIHREFLGRFVALDGDIRAAAKTLVDDIMIKDGALYSQKVLPEQYIRRGVRETVKQARRRHYTEVTLVKAALELDNDTAEQVVDDIDGAEHQRAQAVAVGDANADADAAGAEENNTESDEAAASTSASKPVVVSGWEIVGSGRFVTLRVQFKETASGFDPAKDEETADIPLLVIDRQMLLPDGNCPPFNSLPDIRFRVPLECCDDPRMTLSEYIHAHLDEQLGVERKLADGQSLAAITSTVADAVTDGIVRSKVKNRPCDLNSVRALCEVAAIAFSKTLRTVITRADGEIVDVPLIMPSVDPAWVQEQLQKGGERSIRLMFHFPMAQQDRPSADQATVDATGKKCLNLDHVESCFSERLRVGLPEPHDKWLRIRHPLRLGFEAILRFRSGSSQTYLREWDTILHPDDMHLKAMLDEILLHNFTSMMQQFPDPFRKEVA
jgi:hypothetical protein